MTLKELENTMTIGTCVGGAFEIEMEYRGKTYHCKSTNTLAYDAYKFGECYYYTKKQALMALRAECKIANHHLLNKC